MLLTILVVEDVESMRNLIREVVTGIPGFRVSGTVANVPEARREISLRRPAVVLLDLFLPGESGLDLLKELQPAGIPAIILSSNPDPKVPPGALGWLLKPTLRTVAADRLRFEQAITVMLGLTGEGKPC